jgi:hypothetical protein
MRSSRGGGEIINVGGRTITPRDILVPPGYQVNLVATGLTFPSSFTFDSNGQMYVIETGYSYGEVWLEPKLLRLSSDGKPLLLRKAGRMVRGMQ